MHSVLLTAVTLAASVVLANPLPETPRHHVLIKRSCAPEPKGSGPTPSPDTAPAFLSNAIFGSSAKNATTPSGYTNTFTNLNASSNANGYMGYVLLNGYDTLSCAAQCNSISGCEAFNLFYERDPSVNPDDPSCANPPSTTNIKCVFWGSAVTAANADNFGTTYNQFEIVIAGSNGYVNDTTLATSPTPTPSPSPSSANPTGYDNPVSFDDRAISAPLDCNNQDTYMGFQTLNSTSPSDTATQCAKACTAQSAYNIAHPPTDGTEPMTCQFFNTYLSLKNGVGNGVFCVLYSETWGIGYATNSGYVDGDGDVYTFAASYGYSNATDPGVCS